MPVKRDQCPIVSEYWLQMKLDKFPFLRRSRESSMGELPRPYAPYERKPNKLQILEKLGIELKVQQTPPGPGQAPHVIAVPTSKAVGASGTAGIPSLLGINTVNPITGKYYYYTYRVQICTFYLFKN